MQHAVGINYPAHYLQALKQNAILAGPILARWLRSGEPQWFNARDPVPAGLERWIQAMLTHNMHNVAGHGVRNLNRIGASYCTFANLNLASTMDQGLVLRLLIPHLHEALPRVWRPYRAEGDKRAIQSIKHLTEREREVLRWLVKRKSNPMIAQILGRSEFTIQNQVSSIVQKLAIAIRNDAMMLANRVAQSFEIESPQVRQAACHS